MKTKPRPQTGPHRQHSKPEWLIGQRVRITHGYEPCLRAVPKHRLTAEGLIEACHIRFPGSDDLRMVVYVIALETELLSSTTWAVSPGNDSFEVELIE